MDYLHDLLKYCGVSVYKMPCKTSSNIQLTIIILIPFGLGHHKRKRNPQNDFFWNTDCLNNMFYSWAATGNDQAYLWRKNAASFIMCVVPAISPVKVLRYNHRLVNIIAYNGDDHDLGDSTNVLLWDIRKRWKGKKGSYLKKLKNKILFWQLPLSVSLLFYYVLNHKKFILFFSKTLYYSGYYLVA